MRINLKENLKIKKGITLIALIITIIVLLILAGVSILMLSGENGILKRAGEASETTNDVNEEEQVKIAIADALSAGTGKLSTDNLNKAIQDQFGAEKNVSGEGPWIYEGERKTYQIGTSGSVEEKQLQEVKSISETKLDLDGSYLLTVRLKDYSVAKRGDVDWSSSNTNVATVNKDGIVMCGTETGEATITCTGANGTKAECQVTSTAKKVFTNNGSTAVTVNGKAANDKNPVIPVGYTAIDTGIGVENITWDLNAGTTDQPNVNKGLAIMDNRGNTFIWIPVPIVKDDEGKITTGEQTIKFESESTPMATKVSGTEDYRGVIYQNWNLTEKIVSIWEYIHEYGEPALGYYDNDRNELYNPELFTEESLKNDYNKMVEKVDKYKGFYVGRYETSYDENIRKVATIAGAEASTALKENTKTWYGLYEKQKLFSTGKNVKSYMIWGSQYDAMMMWMIRNGIDVNAYEFDDAQKNGTSITGVFGDKDKLLNIFDLIGCRSDWTMTGSGSIRVIRGGSR